MSEPQKNQEEATLPINTLPTTSPSSTPAEPVAVKPPRPSYPIYSALWVIFLSICISGLSWQYFTKNAQHILDLQPKTAKLEVIYGAGVGGFNSTQIANTIITDINAVRPDNVLFAGHLLAKREVVEYLSAIYNQATVKIIIGNDLKGVNQLDLDDCPLPKYKFALLRKTGLPLNSQVLLAFNNSTRQAIGFIGTYPFDVTEADNSESSLVVIRDYDTCASIYATYNALIK